MSDDQAEFEANIFRYYNCLDAIGDWEILSYAMILQHNPSLISRGAPGRKREWSPEREQAIQREIKALLDDPSFMPTKRNRHAQAVKRLVRDRDFLRRHGLNAQTKLKTVMNRFPSREQ